MSEQWNINGELILSCSCTVFCPCVVSLGAHPPTEGYCQGWAGVQIENGTFGDTSLDGLKVGIFLDIPGNMGRGNWTAGLYVDETASDDATAALEKIFTGQAGGQPGVLRFLVSTYLGMQRVPIEYEKEGRTRHFTIPKKIEASISPIRGKDPDKDVVVSNSEYWMGPEIVISEASKAKVRDFGRVWNFAGRSAEFLNIEWAGPK